MSTAGDRNRQIFDAGETVAEYEAATGLTPVEADLFTRCIPTDSDILDLGVGTGRTTAALSRDARSYVGIDYAPHMVEAALRANPGVDLRVGDAADLSDFAGASFDAVVFSYNGLDYLNPADARRRCIAEVNRVLRARGVFVLSVHNPRALVRPAGRGPRGDWGLAKSLAVTAVASAKAMRRLLPSAAFWTGDGYVVDSARPLLTHMATRRRVRGEITRHGFALVETAGSHAPDRTASVATPWTYYVFAKVPS